MLLDAHHKAHIAPTSKSRYINPIKINLLFTIFYIHCLVCVKFQQIDGKFIVLSRE